MNLFFALVVDVNDPEQAGRVKIRVNGDQDNIPESQLRWARPMFPVTNPIKGKVAGKTTGLLKGSRVVGFYADQDKQIPYVIGTVGSAGQHGSLIDTSRFPRDFPAALARNLPQGIGASWPTGDLRMLVSGNGLPRLDVQSIIKFAHGLAGQGPAQNANTPTIGTQIPAGSNPIDFIKKIDPNNLSGVLGKDILNLMKNFQNSPVGQLVNMVGGQQLMSSVASAAQSLFQNEKKEDQDEKKKLLIALLQAIINKLKIAKQNNPKNTDDVLNAIEDINSLFEYPQEIDQINLIANAITLDNFDAIVDQLITLILNLISKIGR